MPSVFSSTVFDFSEFCSKSIFSSGESGGRLAYLVRGLRSRFEGRTGFDFLSRFCFASNSSFDNALTFLFKVLDELVLVGEALSFIFVSRLSLFRFGIGELDVFELDSSCFFVFVVFVAFVVFDLREGGVFFVRLKVGFFLVFGGMFATSQFTNL